MIESVSVMFYVYGCVVLLMCCFVLVLVPLLAEKGCRVSEPVSAH